MTFAFTAATALPFNHLDYTSQGHTPTKCTSFFPPTFRDFFSQLTSLPSLTNSTTFKMSTARPPLKPLPTPHPPAESFAGSNPVFAQCMLRINNPTISHHFYQKLGMKLINRFDFPSFQFSLYFYAYTSDTPPQQSQPQSERAKWLWSRPYPTVELTWNWPSDTYQKSLKLAEQGEITEKYVDGNSSPLGFGHIAISVKHLRPALSHLFNTNPNHSEIPINYHPIRSATVLIKDPEMYHIVLVAENQDSQPSTSIEDLDPMYSSVMIRVNDPRKAIQFFQHLGMKYLNRFDDESTNITHYFLAYTNQSPPDDSESLQSRQKWIAGLRECKMHLVHHWGSENSDVQYTNGNVKPHRGFGHVGFIVDDIYSTVEQLEKCGYRVIRKPGPFGDVGELAFVEEPSTKYWVELIARADEPSSS